MVAILVSLAFCAALAASVAIYEQRVGQIRALLEDGTNARTGGRFGEAIRALGRGLDSAAATPATEHLKQSLRAELRLAERGRLAHELHGLADQIRAGHGALLPPEAEGKSLMRLCASVWEHRQQLLDSSAPLSADDERTIRTDLLELATIRADLRVRYATATSVEDARTDALRLLDEAERICGPSLAAQVRRADFADRAERSTTPLRAVTPRSAWDHYEIGRYNLRVGHVERAAQEFRSSIELRPQDFWSNFYLGLCDFRLASLRRGDRRLPRVFGDRARICRRPIQSSLCLRCTWTFRRRLSGL